MSSKVRAVWLKNGTQPYHNNIFDNMVDYVQYLGGVISTEQMTQLITEKKMNLVSTKDALCRGLQIVQDASQQPQYLLFLREKKGRTFNQSQLRKVYDTLGIETRKKKKLLKKKKVRINPTLMPEPAVDWVERHQARVQAQGRRLTLATEYAADPTRQPIEPQENGVPTTDG